MNRRDSKIVELIVSGTDPEGLTVLIREVMASDLSHMAEIAAMIANVSKNESDRNNQLSKLRVIMSRICDEIGIAKRTVKSARGGYVVTHSNPRYDPRRLQSLLTSIERTAEELRHLSPVEREEFLDHACRVLGTQRKPA